MEAQIDQPVTYYLDQQFLIQELDYAEMIALSGLFREWALWDRKFTPSERTNVICWSADMDRVAEHVGANWRASQPEGSLVHSMASNVLRKASVIDARDLFKNSIAMVF